MKVDRETNDLIILISFWIPGIQCFQKDMLLSNTLLKPHFREIFKRGKGMYGWEAGKCDVLKKWNLVKLYFTSHDIIIMWFWDGKFDKF